MYKVYNLENYIDDRIIIYLIDEIYKFSQDFLYNYPNYKEWFYNIHIEGLGNGRTTLFVVNDANKIVGICNLKDKDNEKKICSLFVKKEYRDTEIGYLLIEKAFSYLNTTKPFITFCLEDYKKYKGLIDEYNWKLREITKDTEFCYNGRKIKKK